MTPSGPPHGEVAPGTLFHTGIVVDDLEEAMDRYSTSLGLQWSKVRHISGTVCAAGGLLPRETLVTYSVEGPHHLELIEHRDDTAYRGLPGNARVHHTGYWVGDLPQAIRRLEAAGWTCRLHSHVGGDLSGWAYLQDPVGGLYAELVDDARRTALEFWSSGPDRDMPDVRPRVYPGVDVFGGRRRASTDRDR